MDAPEKGLDMQVVVLASTHERVVDDDRKSVPQPLLSLGKDKDPLLTVLVRQATAIPHIDTVYVATNEKILPEIQAWADSLPPDLCPVRVVSDGTHSPEDARGAIGTLTHTIEQCGLKDDLLIVGGDNFFTYDLAEFVSRADARTPALVVSEISKGTDASRFGMVRADQEGKVTQFVEKPRTTDLSLKASCIYLFSASDLQWLDEFAKEHSVNCPPGVFIAWLIERTGVYGIEMTGKWYDISYRRLSDHLAGPDLLKFREIRESIASLKFSTWQRPAVQQLQWVSSHLDLLDVIDDPDPNVRITSAQLLGRTGALLTDEGRKQIIDGLLRLLADGKSNVLPADGFQGDDDSVFFVSATAAESLRKLGYADNLDAVFQRAGTEGFTVCKRRNTL